MAKFQIDWGNPLTNGLIACYVPGITRGQNIAGTVGDLGPITVANNFDATVEGPSFKTATAADGLMATAPPAFLGGTNSFYWRGFIDNTGGLNDSTDLFGIGYNNPETAPYVVQVIAILPSAGGAIALGWNTGGTLVQSVVRDTTTVPGLYSYGGTFRPGGNAVFYKSGAVFTTDAYGASAPTTDPTSFIVIQGTSGPTPSGRPCKASCNIALMWNRELSAAEMAAVDADPYCFLIPVEVELPALLAPPAISLTSPALLAKPRRLNPKSPRGPFAFITNTATYPVQAQIITGVFASAGVGATSFVGAGIAASTFASSGAGATSFVGAGIAASTFASSGVGGTSFIGAAGIIAGTFVSAGAGATSFVGAETAASTFASAGAGATNFIGAAGVIAGTFVSAGAGATSFVSAATAASIFSSSGVGATSFVAGLPVGTGVFVSNGAGAVSFTGAETIATRFASGGTGPTNFVGAAVTGNIISGVFSSSGAGATSFAGAGIAASVFASIGAGATSFKGTGVLSSVFAAAGSSVFTGVGSATFASTFASVGAGATSFKSAGVSAGTFTSSGAGATSFKSISTAAAVFNSLGVGALNVSAGAVGTVPGVFVSHGLGALFGSFYGFFNDTERATPAEEPGRYVLVPPENRTMVVPFEDRVYEVQDDPRPGVPPNRLREPA